MTNEEFQHHISAIETAIAAGEVEHKAYGSPFFKTVYFPVGKPEFVARIKPRPREVWMKFDDSGCIVGSSLYSPPQQRGIWVKMREVL